jgi:hypothetical protein
VDPRVIERFENGRTVGDTLADARIDAVAEGLLGVDGEAGAPADPDDGPVAVDSVPAALQAEVDAAVADLIEGSPRRPARRRRGTS